MENKYLTEEAFTTDDFSSSLEYLIPDSHVSTKEQSDKFYSVGRGLLSKGFYFGENLTKKIAEIEVRNSNACILTIPTTGKYSVRLSNMSFSESNPETGSLILPTDRLYYSTNSDEINDLMIFLSFDQIRLLLEKNYNIRSIMADGFIMDKRSEKYYAIQNFIITNLELLKRYPHLKKSFHFKSSLTEVIKLLLSEIIADSLNVNFKLHKSVDSKLVKKAEALMDAHPEKFFSIAEIADKISTSPRNLQLSFKKYRRYTPMQFLKERKLHKSRLLLINGDSDTLIKKVAFESGFRNLSSFAVHYKNMFGELPSETLK